MEVFYSINHTILHIYFNEYFCNYLAMMSSHEIEDEKWEAGMASKSIVVEPY